jgi:hypothetical protein
MRVWTLRVQLHGLCNAPATNERAMNTILKDVLYEFVLVYLDDIIVFSKTMDEHANANERKIKNEAK